MKFVKNVIPLETTPMLHHLLLSNNDMMDMHVFDLRMTLVPLIMRS
jgi:hypothetical protein